MKKSNYKVIAFILFYFSVLSSCSSQKLVYEPLGIMDKPLPTIEIITKQYKDLNRNVFTVDKKTFSLLLKYVRNKLNENPVQIKTDYEYGSYKIIYFWGSKKIEYIIESKEKSRMFFQGQLELINANTKFYKEIEILLARIL
ncbi:hypothetical protein [Ferruginibacter sp. SUN106]|uniref:hypothetical protein n=1 Tax=Ferruginibacter sp. SUN106 TaxID=2978348 RepID=UPI003D36ED9D